MANAAIATRTNPVAGRKFANSHVQLETAAEAARISFRATSKGAKDFGKTLGLDLPTGPGKAASKAGRTAIWLGPDEWFIIDQKGPIDDLMPKRENAQFSATDISHRNVAFDVSGVGAEATLNGGSPRDLSLAAFPVGSACRTILGKAEIVLWRTGRESFRVECWRSFGTYVWELLMEAAKDAHVR